MQLKACVLVMGKGLQLSGSGLDNCFAQLCRNGVNSLKNNQDFGLYGTVGDLTFGKLILREVWEKRY